jgi:hypothetical protein
MRTFELRVKEGPFGRTPIREPSAVKFYSIKAHRVAYSRILPGGVPRLR